MPVVGNYGGRSLRHALLFGRGRGGVCEPDGAWRRGRRPRGVTPWHMHGGGDVGDGQRVAKRQAKKKESSSTSKQLELEVIY
jgi:hypothetical protein